MTSDHSPTGSTEYLTTPYPAEVWHGGKRYESAEKALLALLADGGADKQAILLEVLRDKFARQHDLGILLIDADPATIEKLDLSPSHDLWSGDDVRTALLRVRLELAGQEVMRTGMLLATHGSLILMGRESDLGDDLVEGAQHVGLSATVPTDSPALSSFEEAMAEAISEKWGDVVVELFEMGKTILLFLSMDGLADEDPDYKEARDETRKVLQESADRIHLSEELWVILDQHGSDPEQITAILRAVVIAAFRTAQDA